MLRWDVSPFSRKISCHFKNIFCSVFPYNFFLFEFAFNYILQPKFQDEKCEIARKGLLKGGILGKFTHAMQKPMTKFQIFLEIARN